MISFSFHFIIIRMDLQMNVGCGRFCKELFGKLMHGIFSTEQLGERTTICPWGVQQRRWGQRHSRREWIAGKADSNSAFSKKWNKGMKIPKKNAPARKLQALKRLLPRSKAPEVEKSRWPEKNFIVALKNISSWLWVSPQQCLFCIYTHRTTVGTVNKTRLQSFQY